MLTRSLKLAMVGGKAAALAALMATTAGAQQTVPTPEGNVVVIPDAAIQPETSGSIPEIGYATLTSFDNDQVVAETLIGQGFTNLVINRTGPLMTVTAQRDGVPTELVYSLANGRLMSVDGDAFQHPADAAAAAEPGAGSSSATATGTTGDDDDDAGDIDAGDDTGGTDAGGDGAGGDDAGGDDAGGADAGGADAGGDDAGGDDGAGDGGSDDGADGEGEGSGDSDGEGDNS